MIIEFKEYMTTEIKEIMDEKKEALPVLIRLRELLKLIDKWTAEIDPIAIDEAHKHGKSFKMHGAKVEVREVGTKWYYDKTGDSVLARIVDEKSKVSEKEKERQQFLKTLKDPMQVLDEETGELITIYPARKESKTGLVVTIDT